VKYKLQAKTKKRIALAVLTMLIFVGFFCIYYFYYHKNQTGQNNSAASTLASKNFDTNIEENQTQSYFLSIENLKINAPIVLNVEGNDKNAYYSALENGVAHMKRTALPGDAGNTVIFGHSSYNATNNGNFKTVFARLNELKVGDTIEIKSQNKDFVYKIMEKKIVSAEEISVVHQDKTTQRLTLMTCWPVGTVDRRLVVIAELMR